MVWLLWQRPVAQEIPGPIKERLINEFSLDPTMVNKLRFSGKKGRYSNRPVKYMRIYDPELIESRESATPSYDFLERTGGYRDALLFEGRIEADERIHLIDQRKPKVLFPL